MARVGATRGNTPVFVRVAAVCAALVNVVLLILWGGLEVLAGDGASLVDTVPSTILAVISGLATAQIVLWWCESPERDHRRDHRIVVVLSFCTGGTIMGELLGWLWTLDGTLGSGTFADVLAQNALALIATLAGAPSTGLVGAATGLVIGLYRRPGPGLPARGRPLRLRRRGVSRAGEVDDACCGRPDEVHAG